MRQDYAHTMPIFSCSFLTHVFADVLQESAKSDWQIPDTLKELVMVDFHPMERVF